MVHQALFSVLGLQRHMTLYLHLLQLPPCLSPFSLLEWKYIEWGVYKLKKFIYHSFGSWEVQDPSTGKFDIWLKPPPSLQTSLCVLTWHKEQGRSSLAGAGGGSFIRRLIPFWGIHPYGLITSQGPLLLKPSLWGLELEFIH